MTVLWAGASAGRSSLQLCCGGGRQGRAGVGEPWPWEAGSLLGLYFSNGWLFFWDFRGLASSPHKGGEFYLKLERETWKSGRVLSGEC